MANRIFVSAPTKDLDNFRRLAELTAQLGGTHVGVTGAEKAKWWWERDRTDPYPNWHMRHSTIFGLTVPDELKDFLPVDYAKRNMDMLAARAEILKEYNLKGWISMQEPQMLPEEIFMAYPDWRGARCDHPRRARRPYYTACTDNPEVRRLYIEGIEKICRVLPIEYFECHINDAGSGMCWMPNLYNGPNGNTNCKHLTFGDRAVNLMSAFQEGAAKAGVKATVHIPRIVPEIEAASSAHMLKEGQSVGKYGYSSRSAGSAEGFYSCVYPAVGIPQIVTFAEGFESIFKATTEDIRLSFAGVDDFEAIEFAKKFINKPYSGLKARYAALEEVAESFLPGAGADIVEVWDFIYKGIHKITQIRRGEPISFAGTVNQRWLTRPFVPFPMELTPEEKSYYRPFQFQANSEEEAADLMNTQGIRFQFGYTSREFTTKLFEAGQEYFRKAINKINDITAKSKEAGYTKRLELLAKRLEAAILVMNNVINAVTFQDILDRTDYDNPTQDNITSWPGVGDYKGLEAKQAFRAEIDNTANLIKLLESTGETLIAVADSVEDEDIFTLNPNLTGQLRKKIKIMMDHAMDFDRLYARPNM